MDNVIGNMEKGALRRNSLNNFCEEMAFLSQSEPKNLIEALQDENLILAIHDELNQFIRNKVWSLIPRTTDMDVIGIK